MEESHLRADSLVRVKSRHALEQVDLKLVQRRCMVLHGNTAELREAGLKVRELQGIGPVLLVGSSQHFKDLEDLIDLGVTGEKWFLLRHFSENAAHAPHVNTKRVVLCGKENFWAPVPESDDLVCVGFDR